ncbi:ATP-binding protein [Iamia majanohamensis]|uniref:histidine kinase n=1 Tax=Iamia majanohamensis TaxID=467976 RepID=A0AAE9YA27_9ACTN|nr:ATP-binding protein [Iamia majanohamensis]WCO65177.1 ATP-binding protein [Iamia majanohamensis]
MAPSVPDVPDPDDVPTLLPAPGGRLRRAWRDAPLRRKLVVAVLLPAVWLVPTGIAVAVVQDRQADVRRELRADNDALGALSRLELSLVDAETGMRGYLATDDQELLEPYLDASRDLRRARTDLDAALGADGGIADEVDGRSAAAAAAVVSLVDAAPPDGPLREAALLAAKERMDAARQAVDDLQARVRAELLDHRAEADALTVRAQLVVAAGLAVSLLAGVVSVGIIGTGIGRRATAVERNARHLARGEPLEPATASGDELGRMTDELLRTSILLEQRAATMARSRDEALRATQAKDHFLSRMSHELRTPLTSILGFGQLLQMEDLAPDDREAVDQIVVSGRHLLGLINEVLDIARIESGALSLSLEPVALDRVVADCLALMAPQAEAAGVTVRHEGRVHALCDQQRTKQVVLNLVSNAIKYNDAEMRVDVVVGPGPEGTARLAVTDTGMGIGPADQERLFTPFERLGAGDTEVEGTGVGLALTRTLVEAMGGTIGVDSERGRGSTFWVHLPAAEEPTVPTAGAATPTAAAGSPSRPVVVYVDDNPANLELMARVFRDRPERLVTALRGAAVRELVRTHRPSVVLADLHLPDISGEDLVRLLRADPATRSTPVVVVSADLSPDRADALAALGVRHQLAKPLDVDRLAAVLDEIAPAGADRVPVEELPRA